MIEIFPQAKELSNKIISKLQRYTIDEIDLNEHCVGLYYKSSRSKEIRVFISETEFIQEKVSEFVKLSP